MNIMLTADKTPLDVGETTTIRMWAQATQAGMGSAAGSTVATGDAGTLTSVAIVGEPNVNGWNPLFAPIFSLTCKPGTPGTNGGWTGFGSEQTNYLIMDPAFAKDNLVDLFDYTVMGAGPGTVTLTVVPGTVLPFRFVETDKTQVFGTNASVTISVTPEPVTVYLLALGGLLIARRREA